MSNSKTRRRLGTIADLGDGRWSVQVSNGRDSRGRRARPTTIVRGTRKDAERALIRLASKTDAPVQAPADLRLADYLQLQFLPAKRDRLRARTIAGYEDLIRLYIDPFLGDVKLTKLSALDVERWIRRLREEGAVRRARLSERSILAAYRVLRISMRAAVRWQLLLFDPTSAVEPPRPERFQARAYSGELAARLLQATDADPVLGPATAIAVLTGARRGEILGLRWENVDLERRRIVITETLQIVRGALTIVPPKSERSRRTVSIDEGLAAILEAHRASQGARGVVTGFVVDGGAGQPMRPDELSRRFRRFILAAGLPAIRFHDLRHTHASLGLDAGVELTVMSRRLGHSTIAITSDIYSHVAPPLDADAAARIGDVVRLPRRGVADVRMPSNAT